MRVISAQECRRQGTCGVGRRALLVSTMSVYTSQPEGKLPHEKLTDAGWMKTRPAIQQPFISSHPCCLKVVLKIPPLGKTAFSCIMLTPY